MKNEKTLSSEVNSETVPVENPEQEIAEGEQDTGSEPASEEEEKTRKKPTNRFEQRFQAIADAIEIAETEPLFQEALARFGFGAEEIAVGRAKWDDTNRKYLDQKLAKADYRESVRAAKAERDKANGTYMRFIEIGRVAFKGDAQVVDKLGLKGARTHNFGGWMAQVSQFYDYALSTLAVQEGFAAHSVLLEALQAGWQEAQSARTINIQKNSSKGEAENVTDLKTRSYKELIKWVRRYYQAIDLAFDDNPQLKEKVGVRVPYLRL